MNFWSKKVSKAFSSCAKRKGLSQHILRKWNDEFRKRKGIYRGLRLRNSNFNTCLKVSAPSKLIECKRIALAIVGESNQYFPAPRSDTVCGSQIHNHHLN